MQMTAADLLHNVNIEPLVEVLREFYNFDVPLIEDMAYAACDRWLVEDHRDRVVLGVEDTVEIGLDDFDPLKPEPLYRREKAVLDLYGTERTGAWIADWKTLGSEWDAQKELRYRDSWQWRIYSYPLDPATFYYRVITTKSRTYEVVLYPRPEDRHEVREHLTQVRAMRDTLIDRGELVWPRNMPASCGAYGRKCPYYDECRDYDRIPKQAIGPKDFSYSESSNLMLCPEKTRRDILRRQQQDPGTDDEDAALSLGKAFHDVMAEIYRQVFGLREGAAS